MIVFADRVEAGRRLAGQLEFLRSRDVVVLGLPRGGVPVAFEVARALAAPLDVLVVRKLGVPRQPELAMGAVGEDGARVVNLEVLADAGVGAADFALVERRERAALEAQVVRLRQARARLELTGRTALLVDDGMATGATARAACLTARQLGAARVVLAVPVAPLAAIQDFPEADAVSCVCTPDPFRAVGAHYRDFSAVTEDAVLDLLYDAARWAPE
ncbi:MAG TPA: phosphoribosyltransferase family protein [Jatrophihabitans sp.]|uniref:phosphoribosyltransferase n=1 Tax=Jatrophihabitans sp. TaxID=1932789 RepID=UPI002F0090C2